MNANKLPKEWAVSFSMAALIHSLLFFGSGFAFVQAPQYGVEASSGGIEINLVAALPATADQKSVTSNFEEKDKEVEGEKEIIEQAERLKYALVNNTPFTGDGSSPVPGEDRTTFYSPGGGSVSAKAGHLKNPPPYYPQEAVQKGQEGLVLLAVLVDKNGRPKSVEIQKSSNYRLLDESALKAVRRWKFDPAQIGMLAVDAQINIPIRFVLEEELKRMGYKSSSY